MKRILFALVIVICIGTHAYAAQTTFQWDISPSVDAAGYRLYAKDGVTGAITKLGQDIPGRTTAQATVEIQEPVGASTHTVVAKAYDLAGNESPESNQATRDGTVYVWRDVTPPDAPTMLQVLQQIASALDRIAGILER